jgi:predicted DNA-binding protein
MSHKCDTIRVGQPELTSNVKTEPGRKFGVFRRESYDRRIHQCLAVCHTRGGQMANKPFISARISEELLEQLEARSESTGETKTDILVRALTEHLNPGESKDEDYASLETRIRYFERWVSARLANIEDKVSSLEELKELKEELKILHSTMQKEASAAVLPAVVSQKMPKRLMPHVPTVTT